MNTDYKHLKRSLLYGWAKRLIAKKGSEEQRELLAKVLENNHAQFVEYIEVSIAGTPAPRDAYETQGIVPSLLDAEDESVIKLCTDHMYLMSEINIVKLFKHWQDIPYADAACPSLWGAITLAEIGARRINPVWLAVDHTRKSENAIAAEIDKALNDSDLEKAETIDDLVRHTIRHLAAPGAFRGSVEFYSSCSLGKAWWCGYLARECAKKLCMDVPTVAKALKSMWMALAENLSGQLTVIAEIEVVSALVLWYVEREKADGTSKMTREYNEQIIKKIGEVTSWCALGLAEPRDTCKMIQEKFDKAALPATA